MSEYWSDKYPKKEVFQDGDHILVQGSTNYYAEINDLTKNKQDSLAKGAFTGNIDAVGVTGGAPIGMCWCHTTQCSGSQPFGTGEDVYYCLLVLPASAGVIVELAMPHNYTYNMAIRLYANGSWTTWQSLG